MRKRASFLAVLAVGCSSAVEAPAKDPASEGSKTVEDAQPAQRVEAAPAKPGTRIRWSLRVGGKAFQPIGKGTVMLGRVTPEWTCRVTEATEDTVPIGNTRATKESRSVMCFRDDNSWSQSVGGCFDWEVNGVKPMEFTSLTVADSGDGTGPSIVLQLMCQVPPT